MNSNEAIWGWDRGVAVLIPWILLLAIFVNAPTTPQANRISDLPMLSESSPMPVSTLPGDGEQVSEPSDPDAEPGVESLQHFAHPLRLVRFFSAEQKHPGFAPLLEKPPQV